MVREVDSLSSKVFLVGAAKIKMAAVEGGDCRQWDKDAYRDNQDSMYSTIYSFGRVHNFYNIFVSYFVIYV
ncbi:hypothetical protein HanIR_Chr11g0551581 [Helianthus annuus]|nr:hypothetical protein HanIR_Chr11g0551581 [Helianthus annuus]